MSRSAETAKTKGNHLEPSVPNGSKVPPAQKPRSPINPEQVSQAPRALTGRRALLDDDKLRQMARGMYAKLGRMPKLDELILGAGGCQRHRASKALQGVREELAAKVVRDQLVLPHELEGELRHWIDRWMNHAAQQLAQSHVAITEKHAQEMESAQGLIGDQQIVIRELREAAADMQKLSSELIARNRELSADYARLTSEKEIAEAIAEDRRRMVEAIGQQVK